MPPGSTFNIWINEADENDFLVRFAGVADFRIFFGRKLIQFRLTEPALDPDYLLHLLSDQVVPRIIAHGGRLVLHASAIETDRGAVLFLGATGRGKSTLSASFVDQGYKLLGDDAMLIEQNGGKVLCQSTYPSLRLRPDSFTAALPSTQAKSSKQIGTRKVAVELAPGMWSENQPLRLRAFVFLGPPHAGPEPSLVKLSSGQVCMGLIEHSFWLVPNEKEQAKGKLGTAAGIASEVPGFELDYRRDFEQGPALVKAILGSLDNFEAGKARQIEVGTGLETN